MGYAGQIHSTQEERDEFDSWSLKEAIRLLERELDRGIEMDGVKEAIRLLKGI